MDKTERIFLNTLSHLTGKISQYLTDNGRDDTVIIVSRDYCSVLPHKYEKFFPDDLQGKQRLKEFMNS